MINLCHSIICFVMRWGKSSLVPHAMVLLIVFNCQLSWSTDRTRGVRALPHSSLKMGHGSTMVTWSRTDTMLSVVETMVYAAVLY